jgi:hypothetical protein
MRLPRRRRPHHELIEKSYQRWLRSERANPFRERGALQPRFHLRFFPHSAPTRQTGRARRLERLRGAAAVLHRADRIERWGIWAAFAPFFPLGVVEFVRERRCARQPVAAQTASALELAEQQRIVPVKLASIDLKLVHAAEQKTAIEEIACRCGRIVVGGFRRSALGSARDFLGTRQGVARTNAAAAPVQNRGQHEWTFFLGRHCQPLVSPRFGPGKFCAARAHAALTRDQFGQDGESRTSDLLPPR